MEETAIKIKIGRILFRNRQGMANESDLINLCESPEEFKQAIAELVADYQNVGISLVRTTYENQRYYLLTAPGKDERVSPTMYGTLGLLITTFKDIDSKIPYEELMLIFKEVWADIEALIAVNYLKIYVAENNQKFIKITPIGKGAMKNIGKNLSVQDLLDLAE